MIFLVLYFVVGLLLAVGSFRVGTILQFCDRGLYSFVMFLAWPIMLYFLAFSFSEIQDSLAAARAGRLELERAKFVEAQRVLDEFSAKYPA